MDTTNLRRKDTTVGPPLRILSLDGGGVRGYSIFIILQELMHRTFVEIEGRAPKRSEIPKPCEHFDLIVGTGTGGLIALMLGRLRLDIETCKDVYVRMTKRVFETDKTIAGIPYRSTLFKASKLEEAIRDCVREHTVYDDEGNDELSQDHETPGSPGLPMQPGSLYNQSRPTRTPSVASRYSQIGTTPITNFRVAAARWGKPNALLYDTRENRTKTAVTAIYKGTPKGGSPVLLRSYDSRKETAPESRCTIWQAGRATAAAALAFKPIQIGQSVFLDEGAGKYNPTPYALDEAVVNEWPGREVGILVSVGTGKRPDGSNAQQHLWWEGFVGGGMGDFAEARRKLIMKIEGCEETHKWMLNKGLYDRGVSPEHYYRFNVDVGVGEFGMNEWNRLADISTNTRKYVATPAVQAKIIEGSNKLAKIHRANVRWNRAAHGLPDNRNSWEAPLSALTNSDSEPEPPLVEGAVELPAGDVPQYQQNSAFGIRPPSLHQSNHSGLLGPHGYRRHSDDDKFVVQADDPYAYDSPNSWQNDVNPYGAMDSQRVSGETPRISIDAPRPSPPPLPPKTPIPQALISRPPGGTPLPYPDTDGPPPIVNLARKPELRR